MIILGDLLLIVGVLATLQIVDELLNLVKMFIGYILALVHDVVCELMVREGGGGGERTPIMEWAKACPLVYILSLTLERLAPDLIVLSLTLVSFCVVSICSG